MNNTFLAHYGVLGMKWGVRRYQDKGGSLTKRGLDHYHKTEERVARNKEKYQQAKISGTKGEKKLAKANLKQAKRDLKYNYKQLKNDYRADKGKNLYKSGKTITGNNRRLKAAGTIAAASAFAYNFFQKSGNQKYANIALATGAGAEAANGILAAVGEVQNRNLRAYYAHKGDYR